MPPSDANESCVRGISRTIAVLSRQSAAGWVPWSQVSKQLMGSVEFVDLIVAIASLPQWQQLFAVSRGAVKLTEQGIIFASEISAEPLSEIQRISGAVTRYAARLHDIWLQVHRVSKIANIEGKNGSKLSKVVQAVEVDQTDERLPSGTPIQFCSEKSSPTRGRIVGQESDGSVLYVAFDCEVFPDSLPAKLRVDRGFLINCLAAQLETLAAVPERMRTVLHESVGKFIPIASPDSLAVGNGLASLHGSWTRFLWGPPGAGKTFALGQIVSALIRSEPQATILIVAPSNRAVDVALEQVVGRLESEGNGGLIKQRKVLRFGYPQRSQIIGRPELLGPSELDELNAVQSKLERQIRQAEKEECNDEQLALRRAEFLARRRR